MIDFRTLAISLAVLVSAPVAAQTPKGGRPTTMNQRVDHAKKRCRLNHGVDCHTPGGLKEWLLLERSRKQAVRDGSHHLRPAQSRPAASQR